jgi:soluble lytic murein transglycosylase
MEPLSRSRGPGILARRPVSALALALVYLTAARAEAAAAPARAARTEAAKKKADSLAAEVADKPLPFDRHWLEPYFASGPFSGAAEAFRRDEWRRAVPLFTAALAKTPRSSPERAPAQFLLATANMNLGEWTAAGALFEALYDKQPLMRSYHAHYAARCRLRRGDAEGALVWADKVEKGAVLEAETILIRLDALETLERWADLDKEAARFLERFPAGPRRAEAMFRRASAMEQLQGPAADIAAIYRRIWSEAPLEAWSRRAEERLAALVQRQPPHPQAGKAGEDPADLGRFSAGEWLQRGMVLFDRNQNEDAEAAFTSALAASSGGAGSQDLRCKAEYHRAQSVFKQRQRTRAAPMFARAEAACREDGDGDLTTKCLYQGARCLQAMGDRAALAKYATIEKEAPKHSYADDARLRRAEFLSDAGETAEAGALLTALPDLYPGGDQASEAMWRLALAAIREKNWDEANRWLDENLKRIAHEDVWFAEGRALYWKARVALGADPSKGKPAALTFYTRAVREYPLSVYTFLTLERMRVEFPEARRKLLHELRTDLVGPASKATWKFPARVIYGRPEFRRAVELARMGMGSDARRELHRLGSVAAGRARADERDDDEGNEAGEKTSGKDKDPPSSEREDVSWITSILLDRGRSWAAAHAIPRYTLTDYRRGYPQGKREAMWRLAYPRAFPELVATNSRANHVPEALQLAIMREESAFNPRIESFANAMGLTQMLVKTARRFSKRPVSRETLQDPARNLEVGSKFLAFLLDRFHRKEPLVIAGYNAGEGAVERWMAERGDLALDEFLETIPYDETRNYTKRVLASYLTYAWLYEPARPVPELAFSLKAPARHERVGRGAPAGRQGVRRPR